MIVIPARLESRRLPRKLLLSETGQPLLAHVIEQAQQATKASGGLLAQVVVACDREILCDVATSCGVASVTTTSEHPNGTSRIVEAIRRLALEDSLNFVINLQADQPELSAKDIVRVASSLVEDPHAQVATLAVSMGPQHKAFRGSRDTVEVEIDQQGQAKAFSRSPIRAVPALDQQESEARWYYHVGVYAYRMKTLLAYGQLPESPREREEQLEQLRLLEAGIAVNVAVLPESSFKPSVDTGDDYRAFVKRWNDRCRTL